MQRTFRAQINYWFNHILVVLSALVVVETIVMYGFLLTVPVFVQSMTLAMRIIIYLMYLVFVVQKVLRTGWNLRAIFFDLVLALFIVGQVFSLNILSSIVALRIVIAHVLSAFMKSWIGAYVSAVRLSPARLLLLSFGTTIFIGTLLLMLPVATAVKEGASFLDALFTATSATCVTGLIVQDTGSYFSGFGHTVILILMQTGGLGIMTFSTLFAMILGRQIGLKHEEQLQGIMEQNSTTNLYRLVSQVVVITLAFEVTGGLVLYMRLIPVMGTGHAVFHAVFHAVSAFCNAGFCLYPDSLTRFAGDITVNAVIMTLIVFGGLGFFVINELVQNIRQNKHGSLFSLLFSRLSVHSKLVLVTTACLLFAGTLTVFFFEYDNTLLSLSTPGKLLAAMFQSVTLRTAGFNSIDIGSMRDVTLFICIIFMFIGASPASTGGGIKTTTFAVLLLSVRSLFLSREKVEVSARTIPPQTIYKSIAILLFSSTFLIVFCVLLLVTQEGSFIDILFEAVSALGTVGLSTGVTGHLDGTGKFLISLLMYFGRVGPLTIAFALGEVKKVKAEFPTTHISVG